MSKTIVNKTVRKIQRNKLTNNTQRVGLRLLVANGQWVPRSRVTDVPSGTARVRDLRKSEFGAFSVECKSSDELSRNTSKRTFYYRINPSNVTKRQLQTLFPTA